MPLSPSEMSALLQIERELSLERSRPPVWRRPTTWIALWLVGAAALVAGGLALRTAAAVVLGCAWAVGALAAWWASRHLAVVPTSAV